MELGGDFSRRSLSLRAAILFLEEEQMVRWMLAAGLLAAAGCGPAESTVVDEPAGQSEGMALETIPGVDLKRISLTWGYCLTRAYEPGVSFSGSAKGVDPATYTRVDWLDHAGAPVGTSAKVGYDGSLSDTFPCIAKRLVADNTHFQLRFVKPSGTSMSVAFSVGQVVSRTPQGTKRVADLNPSVVGAPSLEGIDLSRVELTWGYCLTRGYESGVSVFGLPKGVDSGRYVAADWQDGAGTLLGSATVAYDGSLSDTFPCIAKRLVPDGTAYRLRLNAKDGSTVVVAFSVGTKVSGLPQGTAPISQLNPTIP